MTSWPPESSRPRFVARAIRGAQRAIRRAIGAPGQAELEAMRQDLKTLRASAQDLARANEKFVAAIDKQTKRIGALVGEYQQLIQHLGDKGLTGRVKQVNQGVQAVIRRLYLNPAELDPPYALLAQRFGILSQNDEDGLTWALFKVVGTAGRRFAEIGSGVNGGNSGFLADECGWQGLMVDASEARIERVKTRFGANVRAAARWVTRENINDILAEHGLTGEIDLLSIDIDGNDYWVWEAVTVCSPRVVIVEYNASFGPDRAVVVPYASDFDRHRFPDPRYYGASLAALARLGSRKGYRLVITEPRGVNAYFVRNDVYPALQACAPAAVFRFTESGRGAGGDIFTIVEQHNLPLVDVMD